MLGMIKCLEVNKLNGDLQSIAAGKCKPVAVVKVELDFPDLRSGAHSNQSISDPGPGWLRSGAQDD